MSKVIVMGAGGRDFHDFNAVFRRVQEDPSPYYVLGYRSNNPLRDGRYRHITVRTRIPDVKLEFRRGYYAPRDFAHSGHVCHTLDDFEQVEPKRRLATGQSELSNSDPHRCLYDRLDF